MGQQPNLEIGISDRPRPTPQPAAARRWKPDRPGDFAGPEDVPWGGAFGTTGPDAGYALRLIAGHELSLAPGEDQHAAEQVLAALAAARASHFGRAPVVGDVAAACTLLGLDDALSAETSSDLFGVRAGLLAGAGHDPRRVRQAVAAIPRDLLIDQPDVIRIRLESGERFR